MYEPVANSKMADILQKMSGQALVEAEPQDVFPGGKRPDVLVTGTGKSPIVIEARELPATNLERDARDRFALNVKIRGRDLETVVALYYPQEMSELDENTPQQYISISKISNDTIRRFPEEGRLAGRAADLAEFIRLVSVPQHEVERAIRSLEEGVNDASGILTEATTLTLDEITKVMGLPTKQAEKGKRKKKTADPADQTRGMACAIVANAMIFHERIEDRHSIRKLRECVEGIDDPQSTLLSTWKEILEINYWPIFQVGWSILNELPAELARRIVERLYLTARSISASGVTYAHDVTGRLLQRFITDRKYLASFYTLPASAALLANLAVDKIQGVNWGEAEDVAQLKVADFACGTGALLGAVYEQMASRHERSGGKTEEIHREMIEDVLYGCDVMPAAIHITGSTLSSIQPGQDYGRENLYQVSYGRLNNGGVSVGSLELLNSTGFGMALINMETSRIGGKGVEDASGAEARMMDGTFDLVIMNPPFTRAGSDWDEAGQERAEDDYIKQFRGLDTSLSVQQDMADQLTRYTRNTCYHGFAGLGSAFAALADQKVKPGGVIALVLSLATSSGSSWEKTRRMLAQDYRDIMVVSLATTNRVKSGMAFSADTGMGECLIIARKRSPQEEPAERARFVSLDRRPLTFVDAHTMAQAIYNTSDVRTLDDGPFDGPPMEVGGKRIGSIIDAPIYKTGREWGAVRVTDISLAQTAHALANGYLWLPGQRERLEIKTTALGAVGSIGLNDTNIAGTNAAPFTKTAPSPTATYPCLWNHDAKSEKRMVCSPDCQLNVKQGKEALAAERWKTASHAHINRDFTFGSQALAVAFTEQKTIGGRVWPNVLFPDPKYDYAFTVWGNSTLGLLAYWWRSSRQQSSKASLTVLAAAEMPTLDLRTLTDVQLATSENIFSEFEELDLLPAYIADTDENRARLDRRVVCELLGLDEEIYLRVRDLAKKWCAEPSVHGGKKRPTKAKLAV